MVLSTTGRARANGAHASAVHALACAAVTVACGWVATPALAATPDDAELASLAARLSGQSHVRVLGSFGARQLGAVSVDAAGIHATSVSRPALVASRDAMEPTLVPWAEIRAVEVGRPRGLEGAIGGAAVGSLLALGAVESFKNVVKEGDTSRAWPVIGIPIIGATAVLGGWLGHTSPQWQQVYPTTMAAR
ncbi:MAG TPA: hypothetical protein VFK69_06920 [Candidatus Eisenbacteria bacterium]|nr:hypothetical protein [Candidatus Eisenbacteria bacterium]